MDHSQHTHDHSAHMAHDLAGMAPSPTMQTTQDYSNIGVSDLGHHMIMTFHFGYNEVILFDQWNISSVGGLIGSMIVIIGMAALYEGLKYYREALFWKTYNSLQYRVVSMPEKNMVPDENSRNVHMVGEVIHKQPPSMCSGMHFYQTFLHVLQVTISFLLMLISMTYNVWLCLAIVIGAAGGYFIFGWKKSVIVDVTDSCCH